MTTKSLFSKKARGSKIQNIALFKDSLLSTVDYEAEYTLNMLGGFTLESRGLESDETADDTLARRNCAVLSELKRKVCELEDEITGSEEDKSLFTTL